MSNQSEPDGWVLHGQKINTEQNLSRLRQCLDRGPIIMEHRFYRGARAPARIIFDEFEDVTQYLQSHGNPGDAFYFWDYSTLCRDDNIFLYGKYPDPAGRVPEGGAY